jgi:putative membrane protein
MGFWRMKEMNETPPKLADVLAMERTRMAADRTLMGWTRTALSLIGFGFTIYKFLESFSSTEGGAGIGILRQHSPRTVGLTLISIGVFALTVASVQHWNYIKKLRPDQPYKPWGLSFIVAVLIGGLGLVMFISIILRAGPLG